MHDSGVVIFLANILVILFSAKLFGEIAERWGQPAVLGELVGGVVLGCGLIAFFHPNDPVLSLMAEFGVILLLFETGLDSDMKQLLHAGPVSIVVACVGVVVPFFLGYALLRGLGHLTMPAVLVGAALTATSIGITARILSELGKLNTQEAQIILGAAVIDDILGIIFLSTIQSMGQTDGVSWGRALGSGVRAFAFLGIALLIGPYISKRFISLIQRMKGRGVLIIAAICWAFAFALLAHKAGTALIVGAFTAGLLLSQTERKMQIRKALEPVADIFVPIFFVMVGAHVDLTPYNPMIRANWPILTLTALLILVAIIGKGITGFFVWKPGIRRLAIGAGMIPRGEVGLIFAQIGLASGMIQGPLFAALVGMVIVTTFVTPFLLKRTLAENS